MTPRTAEELRSEIARTETFMRSWEFIARCAGTDDPAEAEAEWLGYIADLQEELNEFEEATEEREAA